MDLKKINFVMDDFALIIIGAGASLIYYFFEIAVHAGQNIKILITIGIILLQQTEIGDVSHQFTRGTFMELMFENISAFGTVGLSTGVTSTLSTAGRLIITMMMFIGRLGPLVIALAVSRRGATNKYSYAQDDIMIG